MNSKQILIGASTRAAAFSALRSGLRPFCADLFGDLDLVERCTVSRVAFDNYPDGLEHAVRSAPPGPWSYVGALENYPDLVARIARRRPLWGNAAEVLRRVRDPFQVVECLTRAGLPCPRALRSSETVAPGERWLVKPLRGAGGRGVRELIERAGATDAETTADECRDSQRQYPAVAPERHPLGVPDFVSSVHYSVRGTQYTVPGTRISNLGPHCPPPRSKSKIPPGHYLQQRIDGLPCAAAFVAAGARSTFLGLTRQLVGDPNFRARRFHYCGTIGPLPLDQRLRGEIARLGDVLAAEFHLVGLFGVDGILSGGEFWPVEINPRYTASVEVLELAMGVPLMAAHREACEHKRLPDRTLIRGCDSPRDGGAMIGKAILFSPEDIEAPDLVDLWHSSLDRAGRWPVPRVADVPRPGEPIAAGHAICTVFAARSSVAACHQALIDSASDVYHRCSPA